MTFGTSMSMPWPTLSHTQLLGRPENVVSLFVQEEHGFWKELSVSAIVVKKCTIPWNESFSHFWCMGSCKGFVPSAKQIGLSATHAWGKVME